MTIHFNMIRKLILTTIALTIVVGCSGMIATNYADASKSPYRSGYDHGASDARDDCSDGCD